MGGRNCKRRCLKDTIFLFKTLYLSGQKGALLGVKDSIFRFETLYLLIQKTVSFTPRTLYLLDGFHKGFGFDRLSYAFIEITICGDKSHFVSLSLSLLSLQAFISLAHCNPTSSGRNWIRFRMFAFKFALLPSSTPST